MAAEVKVARDQGLGVESRDEVADDALALGLYGFGAAAHLVVQIARGQGRRVLGSM